MDREQIICSIIADAGDCRSSCLAALQAWKNHDYEAARASLEDGKRALLSAHDIHTQLLVDEANGKPEDVTLMLVHASEHLSAAELLFDVLEILVDRSS